MKCEVQWIDKKGKTTPDTNNAVVFVRCECKKVHSEKPSMWIPCCANHLESMPNSWATKEIK